MTIQQTTMTEKKMTKHFFFRPYSFALLFLITAFSFSPLFSEDISFRSNSMRGNAGEKKQATVLSGNAWIKTDSIEISADKIELSGDDYRFVRAEGNIKGDNSKSEISFSCDKLYYDRDTEIVQLEGKVTLEDKQNDVTANAEVIEYNQNTETALMQINVNLKQKDSVCTSAIAIYRKQEQILEMSGNPVVKKKNDTFQAREIVFNLDTEEITLEGKVKGSVTDEKKKEEKPEKDSKKAEQSEENKEEKTDGDTAENPDGEKADTSEEEKQ